MLTLIYSFDCSDYLPPSHSLLYMCTCVCNPDSYRSDYSRWLLQDYWRCYHCHKRCESAQGAMKHLLAEHKDKNVSILRGTLMGEKIKYRALHFSLNTGDVAVTPSKITINDSGIKLSLPGGGLLRSPPSKMPKLDRTPHDKTTTAQRSLFLSSNRLVMESSKYLSG